MEFQGSRKVKKPLPVRVVLVRPEYSMNVGMVARVVKNFSVTDLALVSPKAKVNFEALKYAKHSGEILENAKVYASLERAVAGFDLVVGTTGVEKRFLNSLKNCVSLSLLNSLVANKRVAIVFGPEGRGLSRSDFGQCDVIATIPAERAHPVLNLSHAVAVVLYSLYFSGKTQSKFSLSTGTDLASLNYLFSNIVDALVGEDMKPRLRDPEKAKLAFKRVFGRGNVAQNECQTLMTVFARVYKKLSAEQKNEG